LPSGGEEGGGTAEADSGAGEARASKLANVETDEVSTWNEAGREAEAEAKAEAEAEAQGCLTGRSSGPTFGHVPQFLPWLARVLNCLRRTVLEIYRVFHGSTVELLERHRLPRA
jgi:hypothetical protein